MTDTKSKTQPARTPVEAPFVGATPLSEAALEIYKTRRLMGSGYNADTVAKQSFADAQAFLDEEKRIREGGAIAARDEKQSVPFIEVTMWHPVTGQVKTDDAGNPLYEKVQGDPEAYAKNLPADHPVNQRYWKSRVMMGLPVDPLFADVAEEYRKQQDDAPAMV